MTDEKGQGALAFVAGRDMTTLLDASASRHGHLCPKQVLGVRFGLIGASILGLGITRRDKQLMAIIETDGCFADGVEAATGCTVGHRTMRIEDYGKIAATFVDTSSGRAVRLVPRRDLRQRALCHAKAGDTPFLAQMRAYEAMPEGELLSVQEVRLTVSVEKILSRPHTHVCCEACGEEIINEREIVRGGRVLCRPCSHGSYYDLRDTGGPSP